MKIEIIKPSALKNLLRNPSDLIEQMNDSVFIVRNYFDSALIDKLKSLCLNFSMLEESSWHPCVDGCPDYHRIHDKYPHAYVKSTQHAYYFHTWNSNADIFKIFLPIFEMKANLSGLNVDANSYLAHIPSQGPIARIVVHQYPVGGGGQEEHIDPVSPFARIQTIIQASTPGVDYKKGGLYLNHDEFGKVSVDGLTKKGDLILMSPAVKHGVAAIDPDDALHWNSTNGRWIIMPIIINSDLVTAPGTKPVGLGISG